MLYQHVIKNLLDRLIALIALGIFSPIILVLMLLLLIANKGTPFFFQKRPGYQERIFKVVKFKTMNDKKDANGVLLSDAERLTPVGRFVRKTSLDELPQLINVLKGDMSLVGPRPLLVQYLPLYNAFQKRRHEVKPGITGWAQVNGRNAISWTKKFELDVYYVENISFLFDLKIIWRTLLKVIQSDGVNQEGTASVTYFTGNENE